VYKRQREEAVKRRRKVPTEKSSTRVVYFYSRDTHIHGATSDE